MRIRPVAPALMTVVVVLLGTTLAGSAPPATAQPARGAAAPARAGMPSQAQWEADVRAAMAGSREYLERRAERTAPAGRRLAVNLDIDNTMLASAYDQGAPVGPTLRFARRARSLGMAVLVNTARERSLRAATLRELRRAGYVVDGLCLRVRGENRVQGKTRCRRHFVAEGYTLVANVGNNRTDFVGGNYEKAFRLPNYGGRLS